MVISSEEQQNAWGYSSNSPIAMTTTLRVNFRSCKTYLGFFFTSQNEFNELKRRNIRNFVFKWRFDSIWMFSIIRREYPKAQHIYIYICGCFPSKDSHQDDLEPFWVWRSQAKTLQGSHPKTPIQQAVRLWKFGWERKTIQPSFLVGKLSGAMPVKLPVSISSWCGESELVKAPNSSFQLR